MTSYLSKLVGLWLLTRRLCSCLISSHTPNITTIIFEQILEKLFKLQTGIEPVTFWIQNRCSTNWTTEAWNRGSGNRTHDNPLIRRIFYHWIIPHYFIYQHWDYMPIQIDFCDIIVSSLIHYIPSYNAYIVSIHRCFFIEVAFLLYHMITLLSTFCLRCHAVKSCGYHAVSNKHIKVLRDFSVTLLHFC